MPRRKFLLTLLGTVFAGPFAASAGAFTAAAVPDLAILDSVRRVGAAYLAQQSANADRSGLLAALEQALTGSGTAQAKQRLNARIKADFAAGRTIMLDGWVLSVTECQLCALYVAA
jgi:hypothetical protein